LIASDAAGDIKDMPSFISYMPFLFIFLSASALYIPSLPREAPCRLPAAPPFFLRDSAERKRRRGGMRHVMEVMAPGAAMKRRGGSVRRHAIQLRAAFFAPYGVYVDRLRHFPVWRYAAAAAAQDLHPRARQACNALRLPLEGERALFRRAPENGRRLLMPDSGGLLHATGSGC